MANKFVYATGSQSVAQIPCPDGIEAGDLIWSDNRGGIALSTIKGGPGELAAIAITGVYRTGKANVAISNGDPIYVIPASGLVTNVASGNQLIGNAFETVDVAATRVLVDIRRPVKTA